MESIKQVIMKRDGIDSEEADSTIREWLNEADFNWATGRVIWQDVEDGESPGWSNSIAGQEINSDHAILDKSFADGYGSPKCPRFIAEDSRALYFPEQYDGSTSLVVIHKDITYYLNPENPTPYPGG